MERKGMTIFLFYQKEFEKNSARRLTIMYICIKYIRHSAILSVWGVYL